MPFTQRQLLIFGLGYTGMAIAKAARAAGWAVAATSRNPARLAEADEIAMVAFEAAEAVIARATHIVTTAAPGDQGDPVFARYSAALAEAPALRWVGYLSTTGVYGDRQGGWVDETTAPAPTGPRGERRVAAERQWSTLAERVRFDLFRVAGIYGPGRSAFDGLRDGTARRIDRPGHQFGRIHRDDIAGAVIAAMGQDRPPGARVLNLADDEPAEAARVTEEAAVLLGITPPPLVAYDAIAARMSPMARSFWAENRKVSSAGTQAALGYRWQYPSYREGLRAILAAERGEQGVERLP